MVSICLQDINSVNIGHWQVAILTAKPSVQKDSSRERPSHVSVSLETVKCHPLAGLRIVNIEFDVLFVAFALATDDEHQSAEEQRRVLVSRFGVWSALEVRSLDPVPSSVSMLSQTWLHHLLPQVSLSGCRLAFLPPKITIIPVAAPMPQ